MEKLNIAELLKDCPTGMELDSTLFEGLEFDSIVDNEYLPIRCRIKHPDGGYIVYNFTKYGCWLDTTFAKCVIFPKGQTTWDGFQRPFKDGDVCYIKTTKNDSGHIFIFKGNNELGYIKRYVSLYINRLHIDNSTVCSGSAITEFRIATEEEKQKLFDAIKDNGYKWNPETKTLEKLIVPKFKVGDVIQDKDGYKVKIIEVNIEDECYSYESIIAKGIGGISFSEQDNWKLAPVVSKFKVGDRVKNKASKNIYTITGIRKDEYIVKQDGDRINYHLAFCNEIDWELVANKFDISTLNPFDKVLVRQNNNGKWGIDFFGFYSKGFYHTTGSAIYVQCIPYKSNEHLLGTTNDCDEYYKTWE